MNQTRRLISIAMIAIVALVGCTPSQPAYLFESNDLSYYLDRATDVEFPDAEYCRLAEVQNTQPPFTLSDPFESGNFWDLQLEEAVSIALHNSKVIRSLDPSDSGRGAPDLLVRNPQPEQSQTIYDPAIAESDPFNGVEGALADFDAQISSSAFWSSTDRPVNNRFLSGQNLFLVEDQADFQFGLSKKTASGATFFARNNTVYTESNQVGVALPSVWQTDIEAGFTHPLLRGRGTQINRIPVVIARINNDITIADFESHVRNLVMDVERSYWDLNCKYRILQATRVVRDKSLVMWRDVEARFNAGGGTEEDELRARAQYYAFQARMQSTLQELYNAESHLRWLLGIASNDCRMIRPCEEPTNTEVVFDWHEVHCEALVRSPELRRQKWVIKQRELELIAARNNLLPDLNATALYRWLGVGDELWSTNRRGLNFPARGSTAAESLTEGDFQEFRVGLEFAMPVGFRRELAGVRNSQLKLARERARLEDMELNVSHLLSQSVRDLDALHTVAKTHFNQYATSSSEVDALNKLFGTEDRVTVDILLRAYQRQLTAEIAYRQAICDYNKAIAFVHFRKNSLLEYNNVCLAEGPWPKKAYWDAMGHARRRAASHHMNYGWSRPNVISRGPNHQRMGTSTGQTHQVPTPSQAPLEALPVPRPEPILPMAEQASSNVNSYISQPRRWKMEQAQVGQPSKPSIFPTIQANQEQRTAFPAAEQPQEVQLIAPNSPVEPIQATISDETPTQESPSPLRANATYLKNSLR